MQYKNIHTRGFTIFFAVLVGSLALAIGISIYELLIRELALSQTAKQSQHAIYAADAGAECALYWDSRYLGTQSAFASTSDLIHNPPVGSSINVTCTALGAVAHDIAASGWPVGADVNNPPAPATLPNGTTPWGAWSETTAPAPVVQPNATTVFLILLGSTVSSPCAKVTVSKIPLVAGEPPRTTITSQGYNTCSASGFTRVERAFKVSY